MIKNLKTAALVGALWMGGLAGASAADLPTTQPAPAAASTSWLATLVGKNPVANLQSTVALNTVYGVENAYGLALGVFNTYRSLPLCKTGTSPSASNICAKRSVINSLIPKVAAATKAINDLVVFQQTYPTVDVTNALSAAQSAVPSLQSALTSFGVN